MKKIHHPPIKIDLLASTPAYLQIMLQIQNLVLREELLPDDQLPTVRQLAAELAINFNTVARAYRLLDRAGLITTQQGRGTFVLDQSAKGHKRLRQEALKELTVQYLEEVSQLDFTVQEVVRAFRDQLENMVQENA
jgi:GntR family transcriptional regulator